jgi:hypothetical protein
MQHAAGKRAARVPPRSLLPEERMFRNKSDVEIPWDSFVRSMEPILKRVSRGFRQRHHRTLALGSPARVSTDRGDVIRLPIEVRGGEREYAVATVLITSELKRFYDETRLEQIAREAVAAAEEHPTEPPAKPGRLVLEYP